MPAVPAVHGLALDPAARRLGVAAGGAVAGLCAAYVAVLATGLLTLPTPAHPIQPPWLTLMEALILLIAPAMVALAAALCGCAPPGRRPFALVGLVFVGLCAGLTSVVHFAILTLGRHPAVAAEPWADFVFAFRWPSVVYVLDILAWDVFFAIGALFMAAAVPASALALRVRVLLVVSAVLAFAGLLGLALGSMQVRNLGIVGYAVVFPLAAAHLAALFWRSGRPPVESSAARSS